MATVKDKVLGILEDKARALGYEPVRAAKFHNMGALHFERPGEFGPVATVRYEFQADYVLLSLEVGGKPVPSQPGRDNYFDWLIYHTEARGQELFSAFRAKIDAVVPKLAAPAADAGHPLAAQLDELLTGLTGRGDLAGYAAHDGLKTVVDNWKAALRDGHALSALLGDLDEVVTRIGEFGDAVKALDNRPTGPGRR